eukprot:g13998.t1
MTAGNGEGGRAFQGQTGQYRDGEHTTYRDLAKVGSAAVVQLPLQGSMVPPTSGTGVIGPDAAGTGTSWGMAGFVLEGGGAGQVLMFQGIGSENFRFRSNEEQLVATGGSGVERRTWPCAESLEALFGVIDALLRRHLTGQAKLWRVQPLTARLDELTMRMRGIYTTNRELVQQEWFTAACRAESLKGMMEWENSVWFDGKVLKKQVAERLPVVTDVGPLHLPAFSALEAFVQSAPLTYKMQCTAERWGRRMAKGRGGKEEGKPDGAHGGDGGGHSFGGGYFGVPAGTGEERIGTARTGADGASRGANGRDGAGKTMECGS